MRNMKFISPIVLLACLVSSFSFAQGPSGPGPVPSPWIANGNMIYYNGGGALMPQSVPGGNKGVGTINVSGGFYVNGSLIQSISGAVPPLQVNGSNLMVLNYDSNLALSGSNLTLSTVNSDIGSFGSSTAIPNFTVDSKGRISAAGSSAVVAPAGTLSGSTLNPTVVSSSLKSVGALSSGSLASGFTPITNALLANSSTTVNGQTCSLGGSCTVTAAATSITVGTTTVAGGATGRPLYDNGGTLGELTVTGTGSAVLATSPTIASPVFSGTVSGAGTIPSSVLANTSVTAAAYGSSTSIPSFTVNAKGQLTAAAGNSVIAPAGTLSGATLASNVLASSLTSVGTLIGGATGAGFTLALSSSTITGTLPAANIASNSVANAKLAQMAGPSLKGNPTNSTSDPSDIVISSLPQSLSPNVTNDMLLIWDSVSGDYKKINPNTIASAAVAGVASIDAKTGAFTTSTGITTSVNNIQLSAIASDSLLMNATGGSAAPTGVAVANCGTAMQFASHAFGCLSGTSGGVPYFSSGSALGSSAALTANAVVIGGGAGSAPKTTHTSGAFVSSAAASAFAVGPNGTTNPTFVVDGSTASSANGIRAVGTAAGNSAILTVASSATNDGLSISAKGSGDILFGAFSTGSIYSKVPVNLGIAGSTAGQLNFLNATSGSISLNPASGALGTQTITVPATSGTMAIMIAKGSSTMGTSAIASGSCATVVTGTATGAVTTDTLGKSFNTDVTGTTGYIPAVTGGLTIFDWISANQVNFKVCNFTSASITPGAVTINWNIVR